MPDPVRTPTPEHEGGDGDPSADRANAQLRDARLDKRLALSAARLAAVQALYQLEMTGQRWTEVRDEFEAHRIGAEIEGATYREADRQHFRSLLQGVIDRQRDIDGATDAALVESWPLEKVDPTLRAIFRCAGAELMTMPSVPPRVTITEFVDVAKAFFADDDAARFANGVLDTMARALRPGEMTPRASDDTAI